MATRQGRLRQGVLQVALVLGLGLGGAFTSAALEQPRPPSTASASTRPDCRSCADSSGRALLVRAAVGAARLVTRLLTH